MKSLQLGFLHELPLYTRIQLFSARFHLVLNMRTFYKADFNIFPYNASLRPSKRHTAAYAGTMCAKGYHKT